MSFQNLPKICPICLEKSSFKFVKDYQSKEGKFPLIVYYLRSIF